MANERINRWSDYASVEWLWDRILRKLDKKLDKVLSHDDSIKVIAGNRIAVQVSPAEDNTLQLKTEDGTKGLYVPPVTNLPHKLTFGAGKEYVYDGSQDVTVPVYTGEFN